MTEEIPVQDPGLQNRIVCNDNDHEVVLLCDDDHYTLKCACPRERTLVNAKPIPTGWLA